jgi:hypothetical protein
MRCGARLGFRALDLVCPTCRHQQHRHLSFVTRNHRHGDGGLELQAFPLLNRIASLLLSVA